MRNRRPKGHHHPRCRNGQEDDHDRRGDGQPPGLLLEGGWLVYGDPFFEDGLACGLYQIAADLARIEVSNQLSYPVSVDASFRERRSGLGVEAGRRRLLDSHDRSSAGLVPFSGDGSGLLFFHPKSISLSEAPMSSPIVDSSIPADWRAARRIPCKRSTRR